MAKQISLNAVWLTRKSDGSILVRSDVPIPEAAVYAALANTRSIHEAERLLTYQFQQGYFDPPAYGTMVLAVIALVLLVLLVLLARGVI